MTDTLPKLISLASGTLTHLTKVKCVETYPLPSSCKPRNLHSWPNTRFLDGQSASYLEGRGVHLRDSHVKAFSVPYSLYDEMKQVNEPSVSMVKRTRILLDVFQIIAQNKPIAGITAVWDTREHQNRIVPTSMSDVQGLKEFGSHKDSFLFFRRDGEKYDVKLRAVAYNIVLQERPELRGFEISRDDIRPNSSDKADSRGRKNRNIVFQAHTKYLQHVMHQTNDAVEKLVGDNKLISEVKKL